MLQFFDKVFTVQLIIAKKDTSVQKYCKKKVDVNITEKNNSTKVKIRQIWGKSCRQY